MYTWDVLKNNEEQAKMLLTITEPCSNHEFPREELKKYHARKIFVFLHGLMIWKVMPKKCVERYCEMRMDQELHCHLCV